MRKIGIKERKEEKEERGERENGERNVKGGKYRGERRGERMDSWVEGVLLREISKSELSQKW